MKTKRIPVGNMISSETALPRFVRLAASGTNCGKWRPKCRSQVCSESVVTVHRRFLTKFGTEPLKKMSFCEWYAFSKYDAANMLTKACGPRLDQFLLRN